ncbi:MAG: threonylcarbamoyl-AMP synthase [bacterium]|nr:threonylcarbamoyl-AMP synthase [bacterium]
MAVEVQKVYVDNPHRKQMLHAVKILQKGGVIVYPTDTIYGLAADIYNKEAVAKIFKIKKMSSNKLLSFICPDLRSVSDWAHIPNNVYRIMKRVLPGKYTFILSASKEVPKGILQKRKTVGIRVPDSEVARSLVEELGRPLLSTSVPKEDDEFFTDPDEIAERFRYEIDLILDAGVLPDMPSTIVDFTSDPPEVLREGAGDVDVLF